MNLIQKCGGRGIAEIISSRITTRASCANCYFPELKQFGFVVVETGEVFYFDEDSNQYLFYKKIDDAVGEYVMLNDLKAELVGEVA